MENNKKHELELQSNKDILIYYQSGIRNVVLTTALSFLALTYSRFYRGKSVIYSSGLTLVSLLIIFTSCIININLYNLINNHYKTNISLTSANNHLIINILFMISHTIIIVFGLFTFYRLVTNNKLK